MILDSGFLKLFICTLWKAFCASTVGVVSDETHETALGFKV
jgi:hypothetical protein